MALYDRMTKDQPKIEGNEYVEPRLTLSAEGMPLVHFLRWISDEAGVSVIADSDLDTRKVSVDVVDVAVSQLLGSVARRFDVDLTRTGNVFFLGRTRPEDRGTLVRKVNRLSGEDLDSAIKTLLSENGRSIALSDGVVIVGDTVDVLAKVNELLDGIERAPLDSWVVQFHILSISDSAARELGLDVVPALELSAALASSTAGSTTDVLSAAATLSGVLRATATTEGAGIIARPMFLMVDGASGRHTNADKVPIIQKAITESGAITTEEVEFVDIGLVVEVSLREFGASRALLDVTVDLSSLTGFVQEIPTSRGQQYETTAVIQSGGVYLLGEMVRTDQRETREGIFGTVDTAERENQTVQVWVRAYRVEGEARKQPKRGVGAAESPHGETSSSLLDRNTDAIHYAAAASITPG